MLRLLIWQVSDDTTFKDFALKILEYQHDGLEIIGEAVNDDIAKVDGGDYEILAVGAKKIGMSKVTQNARRLNLPEEKLLGDWIVNIPGFRLEKYRRLQHSRLSIISQNCFGGQISHLLGLPFRSPFVNMFFMNQHYIQFLRTPRVYMDKQLKFKGTAYEQNLKFDYPIFTFGDIDLHMNHYRDFDDALAKWNDRKQRINWDNLFIEMWTDRREILEQFDALPYGKKVCFVPFKSDLDSAWYINAEIDKSATGLGQRAGRFAIGRYIYYDPFDMLLYGKKTPLIEM